MNKSVTLPLKIKYIYQIISGLLVLSMALFIGMAVHA